MQERSVEQRQTAIIIGASSGIGRELAILLAANGYSVAIAARRAHLLDELCSELPPGSLTTQLDVSEPTYAVSKLTEIIDQLPYVNLVIFAAGVGELNEALDWELERACIATNVLGFTAIADSIVKHFITNKAGHFVAISSVAALRGARMAPAYNASKAYISNYLEGLRQKVGNMGLPITITDIKPGFVNTAMAKGDGLFWVASPQKAARQIFDAIADKKAHAYVTKRWRLVAWLLRLIPDALYCRL